MRRLLGLLLICFVQHTNAQEFGYGPCCAGAPCGIIPCDTTCAGPAITEYGASYSASAARIANGYTNLASVINTIDRNSVEFYQRMGSDSVNRQQALNERFQAMTAAYTLSQEVLSKTSTDSLGVVASTFSNHLKSIFKLEVFKKAEREFGERARPGIMKNVLASLTDAQHQQKASKEQVERRYNVTLGLLEQAYLSTSQDEMLSNQFVVKIGIKEFKELLLNESIGKPASVASLSLMNSGLLTPENVMRSRQLTTALTSKDATAELILHTSINGLTDVDMLNGIASTNSNGLQEAASVQKQMMNTLLHKWLKVRESNNVMMATLITGKKEG